MTDYLRTWFVRLTILVLVGLVLGMGARLYNISKDIDETLVFVVGEHCASEVDDFLIELRKANFSTSFKIF
ncbi:MAG: hypothetical protein KUG72_06525 [Pseudomonadales bacterium]|nr:hypothetical protein [Pseudomonadales bacterium]